MKKINLYIRTILLLSFIFFIIFCETQPEIIRIMLPIKDIKNEKSNPTNYTIQKEKQNIIIKVRYINKKELYQILKKNNPNINPNYPLLTVFKITIKNNRKGKIYFDTKNAILLDGLGNQYQVLTENMFKQIFSTPIYQIDDYDYNYLMMGYTTKPQFTDSKKGKRRAVKTLFRGGIIYPNVMVEGLLPFERLTAFAKNITLILSDIKLYKEHSKSVEKGKNEVLDTIEFKFKFKQKIKRIE